MFSLASLWQQTSSVLYTLHCTHTTYYTHTLFQQVAPQLDSFGDFSLRYSCFNWVLDPSHPKVAAKLMPDSAHYFEASSCLLCSILAVQVLINILMFFSLAKYISTVQSALHLGFSQLAALLAIGLAQQRYAFINMSIIRWFRILFPLRCVCSHGLTFAVHQRRGTLFTACPPSSRSSSSFSLATTSPRSPIATVKHLIFSRSARLNINQVSKKQWFLGWLG